MLKFYDEHLDQKDDFEVILMHNKHAGATDFATLDKSMLSRKKLKKTKEDPKGTMVPLEEYWGQKIPFTMMLDTKGTTAKGWGVSAYPTTVLIDPEGNLVASNEAAAKKILKEALAAKKTSGK